MPASITIFSNFTSAASYVTEIAAWGCARAHNVELECRSVTSVDGQESMRRDEEVWAEIQELGSALGLALRPQTRWPQTAKAHELARLGREKGNEEAVRRAVYAAFWADSQDIGRIDILQSIGAGAGLDPFDVKVALDIDRFRDEVERDDRIAHQLGIRSVPVVYIGRGPAARVLTGVQSSKNLEQEIQVWIMNDR